MTDRSGFSGVMSYCRMAGNKLPEAHKFEGGQVVVWYDGCICLKAMSPAPHNDSVEMSDEEAVALAETILRLVKESSGKAT
jgi:hypothetical protein